VGSVDDAELRWLYAHSAAAVSAAYEDFGLVPLEAAAFGKPTAALRFGGFLDTIEEGRTGVHFEQPTVQAISAAVDELLACEWSDCELRSHAARFNDEAFGSRLKEIVGELGSTPALFADRPSRSASDSHRSDVR
jgi:glycosyltransferase involved in cell wall biosynthesis